MFELKDISKSYEGEQVLSHVSMKIGGGLSFIVGTSGSGKTTLLKIIAGMEREYEGDVFYLGKSMKSMTEAERSSSYNHVFGFIWQDFQLLEELSVLDNILLPCYLSNNVAKQKAARKEAVEIMRKLEIEDLASQKAGFLSGGQKQRVAIARELMKKPEVIIADEPTAALDEKSAKLTMKLLKKIAKQTAVIIVTHDPSMIEANSPVYELEKGELISAGEMVEQSKKKLTLVPCRFRLGSAAKVAKVNVKSRIGRFFLQTVSLVLCSVLLLAGTGTMIWDSSQKIFDDLFQTYGDGILDISIVGSFMSASGGDENEPNADVTQDISGLYDRFYKDSRVDFIVLSQAFNDISIEIDGKSYKVASTGSAPSINKMVSGGMPGGEQYEVVVPKAFAKTSGINEKDLIGKKIAFSAAVYNWSTGEPVLKKIFVEAVISGVADNTIVTFFDGEEFEYTVDDSFFFSKEAVEEIRKQAGITSDTSNFIMRANTPEDVISIKDELNSEGILPLGRFELIEDIVRLNDQTKEQSGMASSALSALSLLAGAAVAGITAFMRRKEYAIYRICGYTKPQLGKLAVIEYGFAAAASLLCFYFALPLIRTAAMELLNISIPVSNMFIAGLALNIIFFLISAIITAAAAAAVNENRILRSGERG